MDMFNTQASMQGFYKGVGPSPAGHRLFALVMIVALNNSSVTNGLTYLPMV